MSFHYFLLRLQAMLPITSYRLGRQFDLFLPILTPAFQKDRYAQLLTLFALDRMERQRLSSARRLLNRLEPLCQKGSDAEQALWLVLGGLYCMQRDDHIAMAEAFDAAAAFNHNYHLPYLLSADFHALNSKLYDTALENYDRAINCIYQFPPLDDEKRLVVAQAQAGMALCLTMMHRYDEAQDALRKAESFSDCEEYLHARALLSAVHGDAEDAAQALAAFKELNPSLHEQAAKHVQLILDGTHIHFNVRPVREELVSGFWQWFCNQEPAFLRLLEEGKADECGNQLAEHIDTLVPDEEDMMTAAIEVQDGKPTIVLRACYSRSYAAMIAAFTDAFPEELRDRWRIVTLP